MHGEPTERKSPIRAARERRGITQAQLAVLAGLSNTTVSIAERFGAPSPATLERLARVLECAPEDLGRSAFHGARPMTCRSGVSAPSALEAELRRIAYEEGRRAALDVLRDAPGADPAFASKPGASALLGVSRATIGRWQARGMIKRYAGGRVSLAECRAVLAGDLPKPVSTAAAAPSHVGAA